MNQRLRIEDLAAIRDKARQQMLTRQGEGKTRITVHMGTCGIAAGARKTMSALLAAIESRKITDVLVTASGCAGLCSSEPMITVERGEEPPVKYGRVDEKKVIEILDQHALGGHVVQEYALATGSEATR